MNHCVNKWQQNKQVCIQGSLSGKNGVIAGCYQVIDTLSLSPWSVISLCLPPSPALSTLSRSLAHREWVTWNELSHRQALLPTARQGQCAVHGSHTSFMLPLKGVPWQYHHPIEIYGHLWKPLISKIDGWLLSVTVLITVKSSWEQQPNQLVGSDALLCLLHLATPAIIFSLKRSVNI